MNMPHTNKTTARSPFACEPLEGRQMLSATVHHLHSHGRSAGHAAGSNTIQFSQSPSLVQSGLTALAKTDNVAAPTTNQSVYLADPNGTETYSVVVSGTGTTTRLTVDAKGNPVTAPAKSTTTFGEINNTAVTNEFNAIATALGLTAPVSTTSVNVTTPTSGPAVYTLRLTDATSDSYGRRISVDANGNPVGNETLPFSVIPSAIQAALNANAPTGATSLATDSTQSVRVRTQNSITTYTTTFTSSGTQTSVTVNINGKLTPTTTTFANIPTAAQTELKALATANNVTTAISDSQAVLAYDEGNGTTIYTVTLTATVSTTTRTYSVTLASDQDGNPTAPPGQGRHGGCGGGFDSGSFEGGGFFSGGNYSAGTFARAFRHGF